VQLEEVLDKNLSILRKDFQEYNYLLMRNQYEYIILINYYFCSKIQFRDSKNAQRNLEIVQIPRLGRTYMLVHLRYVLLLW